MSVTIRPLEESDLVESSELHRELLDAEFLARCGPQFLRCYHRAWIASPYGIALAAIEPSGRVVGVLLGALRPEAHYRSILRRHGLALSFWLIVQAVAHPNFASELVATRFRRYVSRLWRIVKSYVRRRPIEHHRPQVMLVGEVVHLMVHADTQGRGVGRKLLSEVTEAARGAGLSELVLVTPTDLTSARDFYEHLGWELDGEIGSRSGERFVRYRSPLR